MEVIYYGQMVRLKLIGIISILMLCCCKVQNWDEIRNSMTPTPSDVKVTVLTRDVEERETLTEFKQRVHKHGEWMTKHGRTVIKIKYKTVKKLAKRAYIGRAVIYWRHNGESK